MKKISQFVLGLFAATLLGVAGLAAAQTYYGYNPTSGLEVFHGNLVSAGTLPTVTGSGGCGTLTAKVGGASVGSVTLGTFATNCTLTVTFPTASPNGWMCSFNDLTTVAGTMKQASGTTTTCVSNASTTVVTGDVIQVSGLGY